VDYHSNFSIKRKLEGKLMRNIEISNKQRQQHNNTAETTVVAVAVVKASPTVSYIASQTDSYSSCQGHLDRQQDEVQ
jgi:hypothetical protein